MTSTTNASSLASVAGLRNGTSSPLFIATLAIASSSVEHTALEILGACKIASPAHASNGRPHNDRKFFPGIPLDPPRAGSKPSTLGSLMYTSYHFHDIFSQTFFSNMHSITRTACYMWCNYRVKPIPCHSN